MSSCIAGAVATDFTDFPLLNIMLVAHLHNPLQAIISVTLLQPCGIAASIYFQKNNYHATVIYPGFCSNFHVILTIL